MFLALGCAIKVVFWLMALPIAVSRTPPSLPAITYLLEANQAWVDWLPQLGPGMSCSALIYRVPRRADQGRRCSKMRAPALKPRRAARLSHRSPFLPAPSAFGAPSSAYGDGARASCLRPSCRSALDVGGRLPCSALMLPRARGRLTASLARPSPLGGRCRPSLPADRRRGRALVF